MKPTFGVSPVTSTLVSIILLIYINFLLNQPHNKSSFIDTLRYPLTFSQWKKRLISFIYELNYSQVLTFFHVYLFVQYWQSRSALWDIAFRHPFIRKILIIMEKYNRRPRMEKDSGVMVIDLAGNPIAHYHDPELSLISSGMKIGNYLYCGSVYYPYILRLNLKQYPERGTE